MGSSAVDVHIFIELLGQERTVGGCMKVAGETSTGILMRYEVTRANVVCAQPCGGQMHKPDPMVFSGFQYYSGHEFQNKRLRLGRGNYTDTKTYICRIFSGVRH
jgi:hypothetical protein